MQSKGRFTSYTSPFATENVLIRRHVWDVRDQVGLVSRGLVCGFAFKPSLLFGLVFVDLSKYFCYLMKLECFLLLVFCGRKRLYVLPVQRGLRSHTK